VAEAFQQAGANVVDDVVLVHGAEDDVPEEPAADREEDGEGAGEGFVVQFDQLHLQADEDDGGGVSKGAHGLQTVVLCEQYLAVNRQHDEEDDNGLGRSHEGPE